MSTQICRKQLKHFDMIGKYKITDWAGFSLMVNDRVEVTSPNVCLPVGNIFRIKWILDDGYEICLDTAPQDIYNNTEGDWPVTYHDIKLIRRPWYNEILKRIL